MVASNTTERYLLFFSQLLCDVVLGRDQLQERVKGASMDLDPILIVETMG